MKLLIRYRLCWCLVAVHLACAGLVLSEMPRFEEVRCAEAIVHSDLDGVVAGRILLFNYASPLARSLMIVDLPALVFGYFLTRLVPGSYDRLSLADLSWIRVPAFLLTTSIQWFVVGQLISISWVFAKRRFQN